MEGWMEQSWKKIVNKPKQRAPTIDGSDQSIFIC